MATEISTGLVARICCTATLVLLAMTSAVLLHAESVAAKPYVVGIDEGPGLSKGTGLTRLGPMRVRYFSNRPVQSRRWTLAYAVRSFGTKRSQVGSPAECTVRWPRLGLKISFRGHQANAENGCRAPRNAYPSSAVITGNAAKGRFATRRGTRVGTPVGRLKRQYPDAKRSGQTWRLVSSNIWGLHLPSLVAVVRAGRVAELRAFNHAD